MRSFVFAVVSSLACTGAYAQQGSFPAKPVRLVVPFVPGGQSDILGRILAQRVSMQIGHSVVVDNRPGAGSNLGMEHASKAAPDGYTTILVSPAIAISPSLYRNLNYDPIRDLSAITLVARVPNVLLVHPSLPVRSLQELIALAKANPGKLNFGSGGVGTSIHLAGEMLKSLTGIDIVHVPYKGGNDALTALMGGQIELMVNGVAPVIPQVQQGRVRPLAVLTSQRVPSLPKVPTAQEAGVQDYEASNWYGVLAPAGTPSEIIARLNAEFTKALGAVEVRDKMTAAGIDPVISTVEEFASFIQAEARRYAQVIKAAKIRVD